MKIERPKKIDFAKTHKELYSATPRIKEIQVDKAVFLSIHGTGEPGGTSFQECIQKLYSLAYTAKFSLKNAGKLDFGVSKLECLWWMENAESTPMSEWKWQLLIRIPQKLASRDLVKVKKEIFEKKGLDTSAVERWTWKEGRCLQVLHVGPYDEVGSVYKQLTAYAGEKGWSPHCPGHEIYLSDPRRVPSAKLKTIVRLPVSPE